MTSAPDERGSKDARGPSPASKPASKDEALMRELRLQRNLKILVASLGFLIFAGLGGIAWKMMGLAKERATAGGTTTTSTAAPGLSEIALELPKGARVVSTSISGNRLAVHYDGPSGTGIAVIDLDTGKRIANVNPQEALPRN